MSKNVIYSYFSRVIGDGDYHTLSKARDIIRRSCCSSKADRLIAALELINEKRGIHKARAMLDAAVDAAKDSGDNDAYTIAMMNVSGFVYSIRELNQMGINPVTIGRDEKVPLVPNLLRMYKEIKMNEPKDTDNTKRSYAKCNVGLALTEENFAKLGIYHLLIDV
jgi:hypothetical protein